MPLYLAPPGEDMTICRIGGSDAARKRLESMGFVAGEVVRIVNKVDENLIVKIKGISVAVSHELAGRILISF